MKKEVAKAAFLRNGLKNVAPGSIMKPVSQTDYEYYEGEWVMLGTTEFTYDKAGNITVEITTDSEENGGVQFKREFTYNEYGKVHTSLETVKEDESWLNSEKTQYEWNPQVHDFFTSRMAYSWADGVWEENYRCETNTITRDAAGNVTEVQKALPMGGDMIPAYRLTWKYGADGKATEYRYYTNYEGGSEPIWELEDDMYVSNITWECTNGQLVDYELDSYITGENRVSSADVYMEGEFDGHIIVEYGENPANYVIKQTYADGTTGSSTRCTVADANGSFTIVYEEYFDEEGNPVAEPVYVETQIVEYDDHGTVVLEKQSSESDGMTEINGYKYEPVYDADGNLTEITMYELYGENAEEVEENPMNRVVYGEYIDASAALEGVTADSAVWPATVYNTQGIAVGRVSSAAEVHSLPAGLYIVNGKKYLSR